ncbi:hypothetical protein BUM85_07460 [Staphylococcus epidermidis]|nr:hypothetical protein BUM85_07460 [Staphylococcus epidermidis]
MSVEFLFEILGLDKC